MHQAASRTDLSGEQHDEFRAIVSDLISLVEHVQASINLIETAIARETSDGDLEVAQEVTQEATNVIVLDDVTPQYIKASYTLSACHASLGNALRFLLDARKSGRHWVRLAAH